MFLCNEPITLIQPTPTRTGTNYRIIPIPRAGWHGSLSLKLTDNGATNQPSLSVRIPADAVPAGITPTPGDYLFRGTLTDADGHTLPALIRSGQCFKVLTVRDNRRTADAADVPPLPALSSLFPHWRLLA